MPTLQQRDQLAFSVGVALDGALGHGQAGMPGEVLVVAADPIEPDRVNVYEEWESEEALVAFRGDGSDHALSSSIMRADVARHVVASSGPA